MERVLLLYKKCGETPLQRIERFKVLHPEYKEVSMTYAGRLDPMAEGLLLVLTGEEVYNKEKYLALPKTYQFDILWGFETDTYDALGIIKNISEKYPEDKQLEAVLKNYLGKREQEYPLYSSKTVSGKPLFAWAREGETDSLEIPKREIEIFALDFKGSHMISGADLKDKIISSIEKVTGDFRQEEIKKGWRDNVNLQKTYRISSFEISCSSGTYVRSLTQELGQYFKSAAIALHIKRVKIGPYSGVEDDVDRG